MKVMLRKNFGEFIEFLLKGLNPFKIQTISNWNFSWKLYFSILLEFELIPKRKVVPFQFIYQHAKFEIFWSSGSTISILCKFESFEYLENCLDVGLRPTQCNSTGLPV
jgi:hypothetical protein